MNELTTIEGPGPLNPISGPIDWAKPVETRGGDKVHIYAIDHNLTQPVIGKIIENHELNTWHYNGSFGNTWPSCLDLRNVKEDQ